MTTKKLIIPSFLLVIGVASFGNAWADHGHATIGVTIGPYWGVPYYPSHYHYPPPYYPPVAVERLAPPIYIDQQVITLAETIAVATSNATSNYCYYCAAANAYYPYVKECSSGWQKVSPQPLAQP